MPATSPACPPTVCLAIPRRQVIANEHEDAKNDERDLSLPEEVRG